MLRQKSKVNHLFVNIIEPHGEFNPVAELTKKATSQIKKVVTKENTESSVVFDLILVNGEIWELEIPDIMSKNIDSQIIYKQLK
jgi:hypothetical protein